MTEDQQIRAVALDMALKRVSTWKVEASRPQLEEVADAFAKYIKTGRMGTFL